MSSSHRRVATRNCHTSESGSCVAPMPPKISMHPEGAQVGRGVHGGRVRRARRRHRHTRGGHLLARRIITHASRASASYSLRSCHLAPSARSSAPSSAVSVSRGRRRSHTPPKACGPRGRGYARPHPALRVLVRRRAAVQQNGPPSRPPRRPPPRGGQRRRRRQAHHRVVGRGAGADAPSGRWSLHDACGAPGDRPPEQPEPPLARPSTPMPCIAIRGDPHAGRRGRPPRRRRPHHLVVGGESLPPKRVRAGHAASGPETTTAGLGRPPPRRPPQRPLAALALSSSCSSGLRELNPAESTRVSSLHSEHAAP